LQKVKKLDFDAARISHGSNVIINIIFIFAVLLCIVPVLLVVAVSITDEQTLLREGYNLFPSKISFSAYSYIFQGGSAIIRAYGTSIMVTVLGTIFSTAIIAFYAYPISRPSFKYRKLLTWLVLITMLFSGGLVPWYIVYAHILQLTNTIPVLIIPYLMNAWLVLILRTFYKNSVPEELLEAARIDGAGEIRSFFTIALPLSTAGIATVALFMMMQFWNDWWLPLVFLNRLGNIDTIQNMLRQILENLQFLARNADMLGGRINLADLPSETIRMAIAVVAVGPVVLAFPFFQRFFVKGLLIGAVKG